MFQLEYILPQLLRCIYSIRNVIPSTLDAVLKKVKAFFTTDSPVQKTQSIPFSYVSKHEQAVGYSMSEINEQKRIISILKLRHQFFFKIFIKNVLTLERGLQKCLMWRKNVQTQKWNMKDLIETCWKRLKLNKMTHETTCIRKHTIWEHSSRYCIVQ